MIDDYAMRKSRDSAQSLYGQLDHDPIPYESAK